MIEVEVFLGERLIQKTSCWGASLRIGRTGENDLVLDDRHVSRHHVLLEEKAGRLHLTDQSTNGAFLNGQRVGHHTQLPATCEFEIRPFRLKVTRTDDTPTVKFSTPGLGPSPLPDAPRPDTLPPLTQATLHFGLLLGETERMQALYRQIQRVAGLQTPVLIRGESGVGKELIARAIHQAGKRRAGPFAALNCAAIPEPLIESELFGHEKGAFTGATASRPGKIDEATGGTLFFDEIGELSPSAQAKILRFLQEKTFQRVGGRQEIRADARLISATNRDLEAAVQAGQFRADLYFRIKVIQLEAPPLRQRKPDLRLLIDHVLRRLAHDQGWSRIPPLTAEAMARLEAYPWPGNVRELENVIVSAFAGVPEPPAIEARHFTLTPELARSVPSGASLNSRGEQARQELLEALEAHHWETRQVAEALQISRATVYNRMKKYGIIRR